MPERARRLLAAAHARYAVGDLTPRPDERADLRGATRWMARALGVSVSDDTAERGAHVLVAKYVLSGFVGVGAFALARAVAPRVAPLCFVAGFYATEAQGAFVIPALVDGAEDPWARSRSLVARAGGTLPVMATIMPVAAFMLGGGALGHRALDAWCVGCLSVVEWYRELCLQEVVPCNIPG